MISSAIRVTLLLIATVGVASRTTAQTIIFGTSARTQFDGFVSSIGDTFVDFNSLSAGLALDTELQGTLGVTFASFIQTDGSPIITPHNVYVSNASVNGDTSNKIVGTPFAGGSDDGRVGYRIVFSTPQARAGIERNWQAGASQTRFYNSTGTLLGTHTNTANLEFVGYIATFSNSATWVSRIEIDGLVVSSTRQVGYSDDLIFGALPIPEPGVVCLLITGLGSLACARRARAARESRRAARGF